MQYKILVVEGETDINELLVKILKGAGYQTMQAFSGTEAELLLERQVPDLILLDLMLPGLSGENLLHHIREEKHCDIPVLVLSAKIPWLIKFLYCRTGQEKARCRKCVKEWAVL